MRTIFKDFYEQLIAYKSVNKMSYEDLGALIGKSGDAMRMAVKRRSLSVLEIERIEQEFDETNKNFTNEQDLVNELEEAEFEYEEAKKDYKVKSYKELVELMLRVVANFDEMKDEKIIQNLFTIERLKAELKLKKEREQ